MPIMLGGSVFVFRTDEMMTSSTDLPSTRSSTFVQLLFVSCKPSVHLLVRPSVCPSVCLSVCLCEL